MAEKKSNIEYVIPPELRPLTRKVKPFVKGLNTGIAQLAGMPVDLINISPVLLDYVIPGDQNLKPFLKKPVGGSQMFKDLMAAGNIGTYKDPASISKEDYGAGIAGMLASETFLGILPVKKTIDAIMALKRGKKDTLPVPTAGGVDLSRRDLLKKAGAAAVATAVSPSIIKGIGDVLPSGATTKAVKAGAKSGVSLATSLAAKLKGLSEAKDKIILKPTKANDVKGFGDYLDATNKINDQMNAVTVQLNDTVEKLVKGKGYKDFMKMPEKEFLEIARLTNKVVHNFRNKKGEIVGSLDPLRDPKIQKALDKAITDRGLRPQMAEDFANEMLDALRLSDDKKGGLPPMDLSGLNLPKMLPSSGQATTSLFPNEAKKGRQLLIVSCGSTKCPDVGNMKALDRYLGPIFQSIKKAGVPENVDVAILSAKHGLIRADTPIENYDQLMTKDKVKDFVTNPNEMSKIAETMQGYDNVLVQGGDNYKNVIKSAAGDIPFTEVPKGRGIGDQRSSVAKFLTEAAGGGSTTTKKDIDTLFEAMDEEGALLEFPELGKKLNRYTFNNDRDALIEAITDEDYPAYEAAMKGMLKRTFPSGKIPVRRVENYTELQLFGLEDPETLAQIEQAGLQKLKDRKKIVTEKLIDIDDVKFVGNPAEEELIILDTPRQFRKGAMIGDKQLLSYTINLPKKVENKAKGGIAGLSDVARDMFKGPKGIGAYQPFMVG